MCVCTLRYIKLAPRLDRSDTFERSREIGRSGLQGRDAFSTRTAAALFAIIQRPGDDAPAAGSTVKTRKRTSGAVGETDGTTERRNLSQARSRCVTREGERENRLKRSQASAGHRRSIAFVDPAISRRRPENSRRLEESPSRGHISRHDSPSLTLTYRTHRSAD